MRTLTALAALAAIAGSFTAASAADLSMKDYAPAPVWNGMYAGGHIGGLWNDSSTFDAYMKCKDSKSVSISSVAVDDNPPPACDGWKQMDKVKFTQDDDDVTLIGGVQIGRNWQFDNRVLGVEADVSFADGLDYLGSLRLRAGYARDNLLLYITGGVAFAGFDKDDVKATLGKKSTTLEFDDEQRIGAVVGAGAEYKLRPNMSVGIEGLYYAFSDSENVWETKTGKGCGPKFRFTEDDDNNLFVVRGRLNYHFSDDRDSPLK